MPAGENQSIFVNAPSGPRGPDLDAQSILQFDIQSMFTIVDNLKVMHIIVPPFGARTYVPLDYVFLFRSVSLQPRNVRSR